MKIENFIDEIFDIEAKGILNDITLTPYMFLHAISFDKPQINKAILYIKNILKLCYDSGSLRVAIFHNDDELQGFALLFVVPSYEIDYLHKIFVKEKYRNKGVGTNILQSLVGNKKPIALLCSKDNQRFYKKNGFHYCKPFNTPIDGNFKLSKDLYSELSLFSNSKKNLEPPIFLLNDKDLENIIGK